MPIFTLKLNFLANINPIVINLLPFDSSRWDDSNEPKITEIWSLEPVIIKKKSKYLVLREFHIYKMPIFTLTLNFSVNINPITMNLLPSDSSQWDDSNESKIIKIWSLEPVVIK